MVVFGKMCLFCCEQSQDGEEALGARGVAHTQRRLCQATLPLKNLPLGNKAISSLSALLPSLMQDQQVLAAFSTLAKALPNVITTNKLGQLDVEVRAYQTDIDLEGKAKGFDENAARID